MESYFSMPLKVAKAKTRKYSAFPNLVGSVAPKIVSRDPIIISRDEALQIAVGLLPRFQSFVVCGGNPWRCNDKKIA